jgi:hypothetical protein
MNVTCNDCHAVGEAKTNSRNQVRCAACYSLNVEPLPAAPVAPRPPEPDVPAETPDEPAAEPAKTRRKRGTA